MCAHVAPLMPAQVPCCIAAHVLQAIKLSNYSAAAEVSLLLLVQVPAACQGLSLSSQAARPPPSPLHCCCSRKQGNLKEVETLLWKLAHPPAALPSLSCLLGKCALT